MFRFVTSISVENPNCCMSMFLTALLAVITFSFASRRTNLQMTAFGRFNGFLAGTRCAMSISLIDISLTPTCLKSCKQRFAVCSEDSRWPTTSIQWFWRWTDSCIFQMNQLISRVGRKRRRSSLTWVSFSLSPRMHTCLELNVMQIQIQPIWPCFLAMNRRHD